MKKMTIDGKVITTNFGESGMYHLFTGNEEYLHSLRFGEVTERALHRFVAEGYNYIRFGELSTAVRGYHNVCAICKCIGGDKS